VTDAFEIIYAAHTATCTFLLDSEGICRRIAHVPNSKRNLSKGKDSSRAASRCVGAQYVACLDPAIAGMLGEMPRVGASMLFARVDERGRVSLVRTGTVTRFESYRDDPFLDSGNPSTSVETSAPVIASSSPSPPRRSRETVPPPFTPPDPYRDGAQVDRTQPLQALRAVDLRHILPEPDDSLDTTAEYDSSAQPRTWPSAGVNLTPPQPATLRQPTIVPLPNDDDRERDPYAAPARGLTPPPPPPRRSEPPPVPPPRRSEPYRSRVPQQADQVVRRTSGSDISPLRPPRTPSFSVPDKAASRRRGDR
jgi:hypothetical protein